MVAKVSGEHKGEMIVLVVGSATSTVALLNTRYDVQLDPAAPHDYHQFECDLANLEVCEYFPVAPSWNPERAKLAMLDPGSELAKRTVTMHEVNVIIASLNSRFATRGLRYQLQNAEYDTLLILAAELHRLLDDYREHRR